MNRTAQDHGCTAFMYPGCICFSQFDVASNKEGKSLKGWQNSEARTVNPVVDQRADTRTGHLTPEQ